MLPLLRIQVERKNAMTRPHTRYAKSGDLNIAYQVVGDGPFDLVFVPGLITHVELDWEDPPWAGFLERLASFSRLILFDRRGIGLSDRIGGAATLEERIDDLRAVLVVMEIDIRAILPTIRVPTLVAQRRDESFVPRDLARYIAQRIPDAEYKELPGRDWTPWFGDAEALAAAVERFLTRVWRERPWEAAEPNRVLTTVLFTDIVDSTAHAAEMGDRAWRDLVGKHHGLVRRQLARFRGPEIDTAGDGFLATFDGPARGIRCACALVGAVDDLGIAMRAGLHTGECETIDGKVAGIAVHIGARVASLAPPGEVLVSSTVKDLVAGSGLRFEDRGAHILKGVPGEWRLYAVER